MRCESRNRDISSLMNDVLNCIILLNKETESNFGMSFSRILTLLAFTGKKRMYMNELSKIMSLNTSTSTRMIDGLVKDGFVERGYDRSDRRVVTVRLTSKGKEMAKDIKAFKDRYFDSIKAKVKDNGKKEMVASLKTLLDAFEEFKSQLGG